MEDPFQEDPFQQPEVRSEAAEEFIAKTPPKSTPSFNPIASADPPPTSSSEEVIDPVTRGESAQRVDTRGVPRGGAEAENEEVFQPQSNVSALSEDPFLQKTPTTGIYHVISGSFRQLRDAQKVVEEMRKRGYDAQVLTSSPTTHRVSVFRSNDRSEAEQFSAQVKSRGVPKSWIFHDRFQ